MVYGRKNRERDIMFVVLKSKESVSRESKREIERE